MNYVPVEQRPKLYLVDIDGVIFKQKWPDIFESDEPIDNTVKFINEHYTAGDKIILLTARPEKYRAMTETQLVNAGVLYHHMMMSLPTGQRVLVNDRKVEEPTDTAVAINLERDKGL